MISGILGIRAWSLNDCTLESLARSYVWKTSIVQDDTPPEIGGQTGFYAYTLGERPVYNNVLCGIVELRGEILIDTSGVFRASWCKILELFIPHNMETPLLIQALHARYGVTMTITNNTEKTVDKWLKDNKDKVAESNERVARLGKTPNEVYMPPCVVREHYELPPVAEDKVDVSGISSANYSALMRSLCANNEFYYALPAGYFPRLRKKYLTQEEKGKVVKKKKSLLDIFFPLT